MISLIYMYFYNKSYKTSKVETNMSMLLALKTDMCVIAFFINFPNIKTNITQVFV